jgi:hypothetical protein
MRAVLALLTCLALGACSSGGKEPIAFPSTTLSASATASPTPAPSPSAVPASPSSKPPAKTNTTPSGVFIRTAAGGTGVMGTAGSLKKYCVQVEEGINFSPDEFAAVIDVVLANEKSWIAGKRWMFQRVSPCDTANLRIKLAVPRTVDRLCAPVAQTNGKFSCRNGSNIYINLDRWTKGVAHFPDLGVYRNMVINHEVGHFLGFGHVSCPGAGQLAKVMQRQSDVLEGCQLNPYPYPDGVNYYG